MAPSSSLVFLSAIIFIVGAEKHVFLNTDVLERAGWGFNATAMRGLTKLGWVHKSIDEQSFYTVCDTEITNADNWLQTDYIPLGSSDQGYARKISIQVTYSQKSCRGHVGSSPRCQDSVEVFFLRASSALADRSREKFEKFEDELLSPELLDQDDNPLNFEHANFKYFTKTLDGDVPGIYIGFKDSGSCTFIQQITVSSAFCEATTMDLARYGHTWVSDSNQVVEGSCMDGSTGENTPRATCNSGGSWEALGKFSKFCQCRAGYEISADSERCYECDPGSYKSSVGNKQCERCPANSNTFNRGAHKCECSLGYFRGFNQSDDSPCERPPDPPRNLVAEAVNTRVDLTWEMPVTRREMWFLVRCPRCPQDSTPMFPPTGYLVKNTHLRVTGLRPEANYRFEVASMNSITKQHPHEARISSVEVMTEIQVQVQNVVVSKTQEGAILLQWEVSKSEKTSGVGYTIELNGPIGSENVYYCQTEAYQLTGLPAGDWEFKICVDGMPETCSESMSIYLNGNEQQFASLDPRNLAIAATLLIGIILTMLIVLVLAVCCYRRSAEKWAALDCPPGQHVNLLDVNSQFDEGTMKMLYGQAFVDPLYYDDVEKMLFEFTRELQIHQLQRIDETYSGSLDGESVQSGKEGEERAILYHSENQRSVVTVKYCDESRPVELRQFALEAAVASQFYHPNVLLIHGLVYQGPTVAMCLEMTSRGPLDNYLRTEGAHLTQLQVVHLLRGVACGMQYLSELGYVHKVLTASNVKISSTGLCKISGFDTRAALEEQELQGSSDSKVFTSLIPWMAPEVLGCRKYSSASDSWAFGVLAWEALSFGATPFWDWTSEEIVKSLETRYRLPPPQNCGQLMYDIMIGCWQAERNHRCNFTQIKETLENAIRCPTSLDLPANISNSRSGAYGTNSNYYPTQQTFRTGTVQDWLASLKLEQYLPMFAAAEYFSMEDVVTLDQRSLEALGVSSSKHRKSMLASLGSIRGQYTTMKHLTMLKDSAVHKIM